MIFVRQTRLLGRVVITAAFAAAILSDRAAEHTRNA